MSAKAALITPDACRIGSTTVLMHAMCDAGGWVGLEFCMGRTTGLRVGFHASADEARELARQAVARFPGLPVAERAARVLQKTSH